MCTQLIVGQWFEVYFTSNKINITTCLYSINILYKQSVNGKISGDLKKLTLKSTLVK
jgi:hypothetical protein